MNILKMLTGVFAVTQNVQMLILFLKENILKKRFKDEIETLRNQLHLKKS